MDGVEEIGARKFVLAVELLRVTTLMRKAIETNEMDAADRYLEERERLLSEIHSLDRTLGGKSTPKDEEILASLNLLKKLDQEILEMGMKGREMIFREVIHLSQVRAEILQQELVEPKGQSLNVRG